MLKKVEESMSMTQGDKEDIKRPKSKFFLQMKSKMSDMKNTVDGINNRLDIVEEKMMNLKTYQQKLLKMKYREKKRLRKKTHAQREHQ